MITPPAQAVLDELNGIVQLDGAELQVVSSSPTSLELVLDLTRSSCPECVLPRDLLVELLAARLGAADPDLREIRLHDPRQAGEH